MVATKVISISAFGKKGGVRRPKVIAIASGKGGVGKSNISLSLAISLYKTLQQLAQKQGVNKHPDILLVEGDLGKANLFLLMNMIPQMNLHHFFKDGHKLSEIITPTEYGIDFISGVPGDSEIANLTPKERDRFIGSILNINSLVKTKNYSHVIVDLSPGMINNVTDIAHASHEILLIVTPEKTAVADAYSLIKVLLEKEKKDPMKVLHKVRVIFNQITSEEEHAYWRNILNEDLQDLINMPVHLTERALPYDKNTIKDSVNSSTPYVNKFPSTPISKQTVQLAAEVLQVVSHRDDSAFNKVFNAILERLGLAQAGKN